MQSDTPKVGKQDTIVLASHNNGKIKEFKTLLSKYNLNIVTAADIGIKDIEETGKTFEENSKIKAENIPNKYIAISDDSGLCISCLSNKPGIFSARYAENSGGWAMAMENLYKEVLKKKLNDFSAKFVCCLTIRINNNYFVYNGEVYGEIVWPPKGENGFGYDPFFVPKGYSKTFGEMKHDKKILIDHRSVALKKLIKEHLIYN